ncbi:MAG TPA: hypothetical protein PKA63_03035 [Oligoflexia bacterium]|nr:hypothetical protein [Oligoflexia bacterium]HMP47629.1 hypothetical protein [Oligoflexia bacterium]
METSLISIGSILSGPFALTFGLIVFMLVFSAFLKVSVVFGFIRIGLGLDSFGGSVLAGCVSLVLAFFIMKPSIELTFSNLPAQCSKEIISPACIPELTERWKTFAIRETPPEMINKFTLLAEKQNSQKNGTTSHSDNITATLNRNAATTSWQVLAPSFVISELEKAFSIGLKILLPFLVIDLVIAYVFTALGIQVLSATALSFPLKILAFSALNGWTIITENILSAYLTV